MSKTQRKNIKRERQNWIDWCMQFATILDNVAPVERDNAILWADWTERASIDDLAIQIADWRNWIRMHGQTIDKPALVN